jgi:hypothetical protein
MAKDRSGRFAIFAELDQQQVERGPRCMLFHWKATAARVLSLLDTALPNPRIAARM